MTVWHSISEKEVLSKLKSRETGLKSSEADSREFKKLS